MPVRHSITGRYVVTTTKERNKAERINKLNKLERYYTIQVYYDRIVKLMIKWN